MESEGYQGGPERIEVLETSLIICSSHLPLRVEIRCHGLWAFHRLLCHISYPIICLNCRSFVRISPNLISIVCLPWSCSVRS